MLALNCSIVVSTYQANKVLFISPKSKEEMVLLPRAFNWPMGIAIEGQNMAVATFYEVVTLRNEPALAVAYPPKPNVYDALYMPRATYYTGCLDIHDLHYGADGELWAVNTAFSCISKIGPAYSFDPQWRPDFVRSPEDRIHLNGLAMVEGRPAYVSALGNTDPAQGWREYITRSGVLIDVATSECVAQGLAMPHTPRVWDGKLYVLLSAKEQLVEVDIQTGKVEVVVQLSGFVRGMAKHGDYVFVATSKLRKNSSTFKHLNIAEKSDRAMITVIHLPTAAIVGRLEFRASVEEMYDLHVLPGILRPNIINTYGEVHHKGLVLPEETYWSDF